MTLGEQISLIDAMVKENPDYTIRDYLDLKSDIENISAKTKAIESREKFFPIIQTLSFYDLRKSPFTL